MSFDETYWGKKLTASFSEAFAEVQKQLEFYRMKYELKTLQDYATLCHENVMLKSRVEHLEKELATIRDARTQQPDECCVPDAGEPSFVLLDRDPQAPDLVERWANDRARLEPGSTKPEAARCIANGMRRYKRDKPSKGSSAKTYDDDLTDWLRSRKPEISAGDNLPGNLVTVPIDQMESIYGRFKRLTKMGQATLAEWDAMPEELAALRRAIFDQADMGAVFAGNWLRKRQVTDAEGQS